MEEERPFEAKISSFNIILFLLLPSYPDKFFTWFLKNEAKGTSLSLSFSFGELLVSRTTVRWDEEDSIGHQIIHNP